MVYDITWHDEQTLSKVQNALFRVGLNSDKVGLAIQAITNDGILFRETSVGRTISFGEGSSEADLRQRTEQLNSTLGPGIKSYRITEDPPAESSEEAMRRFWERDRIREDTLRKITDEYYRPLRSDPDQNPFKKLEHEERQDDSSLD